MKLLFSELVEINELQSLCEIFSNLTGFVTAILDMEGNVLTATGWQDICMEFHRKNPAAAESCRESDTSLGEPPSPGAKYTVYRCRNGLIDVSVPIMIENEQVGRLYTGQFLFAPPDFEFFRRQAAEYGFDETSYLEAVQKVPIVSEEKVDQVMEFLCRLAEMIGQMGLGNQRLREANEELRIHRQELERRVEERTAELSVKNEQLRMEIDERKHAEESLRESEEKYRVVADFTYDWETWIGPHGGFIYVSPSCKRITGYSTDDFTNDSAFFVKIVHPDDSPIVEKHYEEVLTGNIAVHQIDFRIINCNGEERWIEHICQSVFGINGKWLGQRASNRDITDRKRAEELLRENLIRLQTMVRNAPLILYGVDRKGVFTLSEGKGLAGMGLNPGEIVGLSAFDVYRDYPDCLENFRRALSGEAFKAPVHFGDHVYDAYHEPVFSDDGVYAGTFGVVVDVTERTQAEEALRQANMVVENSPVVFFRWRAAPGWPVELVSRNVTQFGYTPDELLSGSVPFSSMVHPQDLERVSAEVWEYTDKGVDNFQQEYRIVAKSGDVRWVYDRTVIERDAKGRVSHYNGIVMDITDRKRTENVMAARMRLLQCAETHTLDELLEATLDEAEALTGSLIGFYVFLLEDQKTLSLQNWSTRTKRDYCKAEGKGLHYDISEAGVWVDCVLQRRPVIHNDYASLPHRKGLPSGHAPLVRELVVPVFRGKSIVAILAVGNKPRDYTPEDVEMVSLLADLAWTIVERTRSENAIRESENKFRVLAETSPTAIFLFQGEMIIYANPATERLFGYTADELLRMRFWDWAHKDFREMVRTSGLARQRGEAVPCRYESRFVTKNGEDRWLVVSAGLIEYHGRPAGVASFLDITEIKRVEEQLRASLAEKEVLLKEVHHRVKNNLQIISTLLELQADTVHDDILQKSLKDCQDRIKAMALIHEKLYQSSDLVHIDFWEYIESLVGHLLSSYVDDPQRIVMKVDVGDIPMGIEKAIPCGLIINELVSNAIKHAFPNGRNGEIAIRLRADDRNCITLTVADDGVGLPPGLDFRNTETLGLQLVNLLTKQLRGEITLLNKEGATFTIRFKS